MNIQSLSIVVPGKSCINDCYCCVSKMHGQDYKNHLEENLPFYDLYLNDYIKRLEFCRDNGCNTVMLTGGIEPQQNKRFLVDFGIMLRLMKHPFRNIEMQTTGTLIDEKTLRFIRNHVGVSTIALSLFSLDDNENHWCKNTPRGLIVGIKQLCCEIKRYDFNLRLCLNLTRFFNQRDVDLLFDDCKALGADQITFRRLFSDNDDTSQGKWVMENSIDVFRYECIKNYVLSDKFKRLRQLEYGQNSYSVKGMSVMLDEDCMAKENKPEYKYLVLRPNGRLYGSWDDPASLIF